MLLTLMGNLGMFGGAPSTGGGSPLPKKFRHRRSWLIPAKVRVEPVKDLSKQIKDDEEIIKIINAIMGPM